MEAFAKIKNIAIVVCIVAIAALTHTTFSLIDENQRLETQRNGMLAHAYELSSQLGKLEKENDAGIHFCRLHGHVFCRKKKK